MFLLDKALKLIKRFEGLRLEAYLDGGGVPTIGWGTTIYHNNTKVKLGDTITQEKAHEELLQHCIKTQDSILQIVSVELSENQLSALISFVYNIGLEAFKSSTMLKLINESSFKSAAKQFDRWVYDNKVKIKGLVYRRLYEKELFLL